MPMISIRDSAAGSGGGLRPAYLAEPVPVSDRPGPWPGVIVVHDAFGLGDDIREQADWLAASGYVALAPDLYNGKSMVRCIKSIATQLMAQQGDAFRQIEVARSHLAGLIACVYRASEWRHKDVELAATVERQNDFRRSASTLCASI
jgi:dienelactone hydrolase